MRRRLSLLLLVGAALVPVPAVRSEYATPLRASPFEVPPRLRPRVDFWKSVFTRYGRRHVIVHHRAFPQAVFDVVDLSDLGDTLSGADFERAKKDAESSAAERVKASLARLAEGHSPRSRIDASVERAMRLVPGGREKYEQAVTDDLVRVQSGIRERFAESVRRAGRYLPHMEEIFRLHGLPVELTRLPFIESSFDVDAYSSVGAAGIWQFMRGTAKGYMRVHGSIDERRDPLVASRAAASYLKDAYARLGSWPLAITSYNHGVAGVAKKVRELGTSDISEIVEHPTVRLLGFASNNFYPEFLAAVEVYRDRHVHFPDVRPDPAIRFRERRLDRPVTVNEAARSFGVSVDDLKTVNYSFGDRVWYGRERVPAGYSFRVPGEGRIVAADAAGPAAVSVASSVYGNSLTHVVGKGDTLKSVATRYKVTLRDLRRLNGLPDDASLVAVGSKLVIRGPEGAERPRPTSPDVKTVKPVRTVHVVRRGESLSSVADKYHTTVFKLRELNNLRTKSVVAGQRLVVKVSEEEVPRAEPTKRVKSVADEVGKGKARSQVRRAATAKTSPGKKVSARKAASKVPKVKKAKAGRPAASRRPAAGKASAKKRASPTGSKR